MLINCEKAARLIKEYDDVLILMHQSPDGDTIGAGFALFYLFQMMSKRARLACPDPLPERYNYLYCGYDEMNFEPKYIISADIADRLLLGGLEAEYADRISLCIDHHISNSLYAQNILLYPNASATCEIVYELIMQTTGRLTENIVKCIYTGIATDTGCFKFSNTTSKAHTITARLMDEFPLNYASINRLLFDVKSFERIALEGKLINTMDMRHSNRCAIAVITSDMLAEISSPDTDLDGITALPMQYEGVEVGVLIRQQAENEYKISMRSASKVNVSAICQKLGGGGHVKAAGCRISGPLGKVKEIVSEAVLEALK